jgi:xylulokinase
MTQLFGPQAGAACVIGLDIGTTSTIGILLGLPDSVLAIASRPVTLSAPAPGWAEQDPMSWWANVRDITRELLGASGVAMHDLRGIGVTGMLPAVVLLDAEGQLIRPSIQQSDGRCGAEVELLRAEIDEALFLARAGNGINQQLVTAKLRWLERHEPEAFGRIATVFGSYDFINWRLTGMLAVEQNWALESGFVDLARACIADDLVALAHVPRAAVPRRVPSHAILGTVTPQAAAETGLPAGLPVVGGAADHVASAFAAGVVAPGDMLLKFGGSVDVLVATDRATPDARLYLDHHLIPGLFMPNGCMSTGGSTLNWFIETFAARESAAAAARGLTPHQWLDQLAEAVPPGAGGVRAAPFFLGEKTPIHDPTLRGMFAGLSFAHGLPHLWRALLEAYAYAIRHHVEVFNAIGYPTLRFIASDGGANSRLWMQIVADVLGAPIERLRGHPGSCLGAAFVAAVGTGLVTDWSAVGRFVSRRDVISPRPDYFAVYAKGYAAYRELATHAGGSDS